jgi:hypothetical protein
MSGAGGSVTYDARYGHVYTVSLNFGNGVSLPASATYALQLEYLGIWTGTSSVRFAQGAYSGGDAYGPVMNQTIGSQPTALRSIDAIGNAAFVNGGGADLLLTLNYSSASGGTISTSSASPTQSGSSNTSSSNSQTVPICFARGTQIKTAQGLALVESLNSYATVIHHEGKATNVKWIGYQRRTPEFAQFDDYLPVKICAGALEENVPVRDLYLSPDHAVLVDGHLIHAQALVNGRTIIKMTEWEGDIEYYHIETENHEIIFAEGVPCETFIDNVSREQFDNYAEYQALYPYTQMMRELPLPRVKFRRQMPSAIWRRLMERADLITAAQDQA